MLVAFPKSRVRIPQHCKSVSHPTVHLDGAHVEVHHVAGRGEGGQGQGRVRLLATVPRPEHGQARPLRLHSVIEQVWKYSTEVQIDNIVLLSGDVMLKLNSESCPQL